MVHWGDGVFPSTRTTDAGKGQGGQDQDRCDLLGGTSDVLAPKLEIRCQERAWRPTPGWESPWLCSLTIAQGGLLCHTAPVSGTLDTGPHTEEVTCTSIKATDNGACLLGPVHVHPQWVS